MHKAIITDGFDNPLIERSILEPLGCTVTFAGAKTPAELILAVAEADYVMTGLAPLNAQVVGAMAKAKVIVRYGIGVDSVDLAAAAAKRIPVCNVPDYCVNEVADHTLALLLDLTRQVSSSWQCIQKGEWKLARPYAEMRCLRDMNIGLVAFGRIGREVAARLLACKAKVLVFDPAVDAAAVTAAGCEAVSFADLLARSDAVSLHCPSTPKTRGMITASVFAQMKPGALFINASRGDLVIQPDLVAALQSGHLSGAGLDVTSPEPIPRDSPLLTMNNVVITPHAASASGRALHTLRSSVANTVACAVRGEKLPNVVNGIV